MLLSALNGVAMVSLGTAVASALSSGPDLDDVVQPQIVHRQVETLHHDGVLATAEDGSTELSQTEIAGLEEVGLGVQAMGSNGETAAQALRAYRSRLKDWRAAGSPDSGEPRERLDQAYLSLVGSLYAMSHDERADWMDGALIWLPWFTGWIVLVAVITVAMSFQLRRMISLPLMRMIEAAGRVTSGDLAQPIRVDGAVAELAELANALEQARQSLAKSIEKRDEQNTVMRTMLSGLGDGVLFLDEEGLILEHTKRAEQILEGLSAIPLREDVPLSGVLPDLPQGALDSGETTEHLLHLGDQGRHHIEVRVAPAAGEGRSFVAVIADITKEVEIDNLKQEFLSVVTHELKTPLTAIEGYVRLLLMGKGGELSRKQTKFLTITRDQVEVLKAMIQDLLDATRLEGGNLQIHPVVVDAPSLIEDIGQSMKGGAEKLDFTWDGGPVAQIRVDPMRLRQILGNFLSNAFKFTPEGGSVRMWAVGVGERLHLHVQDSGRGIPEAALPRLFDKFYQVERGDKRLSGGAGLGLYICDQLAKQMGGAVAVESTLGEGSRFSVSFPLARDTMTQES